MYTDINSCETYLRMQFIMLRVVIFLGVVLCVYRMFQAPPNISQRIRNEPTKKNKYIM